MTTRCHFRRFAAIAVIGSAALAGWTTIAGARPVLDRDPRAARATIISERPAMASDWKNGDARTLQVMLQYGPDSVQNIHLGDPGPSVGDRVVFAADAFRAGQRVGVGAGECVIVRFRPGGDQPQEHMEHCNATLSLTQGQITFQWLIDRIRDQLPA